MQRLKLSVEEASPLLEQAKLLEDQELLVTKSEGNYRIAEGNLKLAQADLVVMRRNQVSQVGMINKKYGINLLDYRINAETFELTPIDPKKTPEAMGRPQVVDVEDIGSAGSDMSDGHPV